MAKYLVTSNSYFRPFTYDELAKPIMQMQEAHNAAQDAYDQLSLETNALENYISAEGEDDAQARQLYNSYKTKLNTLQQNLWDNGYNAQTRRDLAAARAGYASDISRLGKAIQARQERSKEYWDTRHKNPDLIVGTDPGASGLDNYLRDDNYGRDYYTYSGQDFMKEVGLDAKARAGEMLRQADVIRDPRLRGYLERIQMNGFTSQEVADASAAVRSYLGGNGDAMNSLTEPAAILANVLVSHLESTGARDKVDSSEFERLLRYGEAGLAQAVGTRKSDTLKDLEWAEAQQWNQFVRQQQYKAAEKAAAQKIIPSNQPLVDKDIDFVNGKNTRRAERQTRRYASDNKFLLTTEDGREIHNAAEASELVFSGEERRRYAQMLGFDPGRTPGKRDEAHYLSGTVTMDGELYYTRYNPYARGGKGAVEYSRTGSKGSWIPSPSLTDIYNEARASFEKTRDSYKDTEIGKAATIDPDKQYADYSKHNIAFTTPLTDFRASVMENPDNASGYNVGTVVTRRGGSDSAKYIERFSDMISSSLVFNQAGDAADKTKNRRIYKGNSGNIHLIDEYGNLKNKAVKDPDSVFKFKDGNITNIREIQITPDSILDMNSVGSYGKGYIICKLLDNKKVAVNVDMLNSSAVANAFAMSRQAIVETMNDPYLRSEDKAAISQSIADELANTLKYLVGFELHDQTEGNTTTDQDIYL